MQYLTNLFAFDWVQTKSPAGAIQWVPKNADPVKIVPDAHDPSKRHAPIMFTTDLALKFDPSYRKIAERFMANPKEFELAFAKAWFKLTHRDMGPRARYVGTEVPKEDLIWQDPVPAVDHPLIDDQDAAALKAKVLASGLSICRAGLDRLGLGVEVPWFRHARRRREELSTRMRFKRQRVSEEELPPPPALPPLTKIKDRLIEVLEKCRT